MGSDRSTRSPCAAVPILGNARLRCRSSAAMDETTSTFGEQTGATPGQQIGSYRIVQPLGAGGMSSVYLAVHVETGHEVALKVLTRSLARNAVLLQRFLREARSAETLDHSSIVAIYDRGMDRGRHYLVLEHVAGGDLHDYVHRQGPMSAAEAISVIRDVAGGLKYAAGRGLIHRDIKPSNLLRSPTGQVKIIDLGLALHNQIEDERVTRDGTTVGTVDYMAPEQARDSRATSIQSDIYSLGCTFYFLLTGVPPFPGGDITDKLTRHARTPAPNVSDLRPDVPPALSSLIQRMMAKKPEDRFASYDDLTAALREFAVAAEDKVPAITLVPLAEPIESSDLALLPQSGGGEYALEHNGSSAETSLPPISLAELVEDLPPVRSPGRAPLRAEAERFYSARGIGLDRDDGGLVLEPATVPGRSRSGGSAPAWIIAGGLIGVAFVIMVLGLVQFMSPATDMTDTDMANGDVGAAAGPERAIASQPGPGGPSAGAVERRPIAGGTRKAAASPNAARAPEAWVEPADTEPDSTDAGATPSITGSAASNLPAWARSPIPERLDGPLVVVRRVADSNEPSVVSTLHQALNGNAGGTVELADEGPHFVDDLRFSGESRLIRARPGIRPIIRVERSSQESVRDQSAVFMLDRKALTLDGIDLVLSARELAPRQTALFSCSGASLTLRNCTITIVDPAASGSESGIDVFRTGSATTRPTRIRLERSLVRGKFAAGIDINGGPCEVVLNQSLMIGRPGPLVRVQGADSAAERRLFLCRSVLVSPGPVIAKARSAGGSTARPLSVWAYGTSFGRLQGTSIATIISSESSAETAAKQIDWAGDENLYVGWNGFLASSHTVSVPNLESVRSTWRDADRKSQEAPDPWPHPSDFAAVLATDLVPYLPLREQILRQMAKPRSGLIQKSVGAYSWPLPPDPASTAVKAPGASPVVFRSMKTTLKPTITATGEPGLIPVTTAPAGAGQATAASSVVGDALELTFPTGAAQWNGDLGAFLHERLTLGVKYARVRVTGSGPHRFTPVKLAHGLRLEIRVEPISPADPPVWSPQPQSTGESLIELDGGALTLENLVLRHDETTRLEHLIKVQNGHLVLSHCRITAPAASGDFSGDLIEFRATTQPLANDLQRSTFVNMVDRPVCRIVDSILITSGVALKAELGRGLVALSQCAVAAGDAAFDLVPSKVARSRFVADLVMDRCTVTSERSIVRFGPWLGAVPGPDRPWLINSQNCAFLAMYDRPTRDTVLLRADAEALAKGAISWQAEKDAADVDCFTVAGQGPLPPTRARDLRSQWIHFWGDSHILDVTGPLGSRSVASVRFWERLRPGHIEPEDLVLEPSALTVGADLSRQGITYQASRRGRRRN
jgi:eukaryotic-like serine/threonine-protein kinase